jgi:signal transduction histidine kinase
MSESFLTRTSHSHFNQSSSLTPLQSQMDGWVSTFIERSTDFYSLAGIAIGGAGGRLGRSGSLNLSRPFARLFPNFTLPLTQAGSWGIGLVTEATLFEAIPRISRFASGNGDFSLLHWFGEEGVRNRALYSGISLLGLRLAAVVSASQNPISQGLFQSAAILGSHQVASFLKIADAPRESWGHQIAEAQTMVFHLWTGVSLMHRFTPGFVQWGQTKNLMMESKGMENRTKAIRSPLPLFATAIEGNGKGEINEIGIRGMEMASFEDERGSHPITDSEIESRESASPKAKELPLTPEEEIQALKKQNLELAARANAATISSGVIHELNNFLNVMGLFSQMTLPDLLEVYETHAAKNSRSSQVRSGVQRFEKSFRLATNLLHNYKSILQGSGSLNNEKPFPLKPVLQEALELNERMRTTHNIALEVDILQNKMKAVGNSGFLVQAILNLLINACHAMREGGKIKVRSFQNEEQNIIEIMDTGIGIPAENLPHLFEPFRTTKKEGTGLGLFMVKKIIEEVHGGKIEVESKVGVGTTVRILLPIP